MTKEILIYHIISTWQNCAKLNPVIFFSKPDRTYTFSVKSYVKYKLYKNRNKNLLYQSKLTCIILVLIIPHWITHGAVLGMQWDVNVIWSTHWSSNTLYSAFNDLNHNVLALFFLYLLSNYCIIKQDCVNNRHFHRPYRYLMSSITRCWLCLFLFIGFLKIKHDTPKTFKSFNLLYSVINLRITSIKWYRKIGTSDYMIEVRWIE